MAKLPSHKLFNYLGCSRLPLVLMTIAYFQIVRVLWRSDTIPGHSNLKAQKPSYYRSKLMKKKLSMAASCTSFVLLKVRAMGVQFH